jgi:hypothetical protein
MLLIKGNEQCVRHLLDYRADPNARGMHNTATVTCAAVSQNGAILSSGDTILCVYRCCRK